MANKIFLRTIALVLGLLELAKAVSWQAVGNLSEENRTAIWAPIKGQMPYVSDTNPLLKDFATYLSGVYNGMWSEAWNVFIFQLFDTTFDAVLVGYAFRNHWMWFNGYKQGQKYYSFLIWKDYNCVTWNSLGTSDFQDTMQSYNRVWDAFSTASIDKTLTVKSKSDAYDDVWNVAWQYVDVMTRKNPSKAYTIVAIPNGFGLLTEDNPIATSLSPVGGRFCSDGGSESFIFTHIGNLAKIGESNKYGEIAVIIIEMRTNV